MFTSSQLEAISTANMINIAPLTLLYHIYDLERQPFFHFLYKIKKIYYNQDMCGQNSTNLQMKQGFS